MLDLSATELPDSIEANKHTYKLDTDFKRWLDFPDHLKAISGGDMSGYNGLFAERAPFPTNEVAEALIEFFQPKNEIPRDASTGDKVLDLKIDGDYIYAAFIQAYGIDLIDSTMHWHKFLALMAGLPSDTVMSDIISFRAYKGKDKDLKEQKYKWSLPTELTEEEQQLLDEFNEYF